MKHILLQQILFVLKQTIKKTQFNRCNSKYMLHRNPHKKQQHRSLFSQDAAIKTDRKVDSFQVDGGRNSLLLADKYLLQYLVVEVLTKLKPSSCKLHGTVGCILTRLQCNITSMCNICSFTIMQQISLNFHV